ncbi:hypothetical protein HU200_011377 [Digitaria exilis]|uniref:Uncharacterized protein n=1 Tax=Digitaria exilis TaxID=1010633 RepID=A0A835FGB6_9POAL|nr:hypothetical protein HU200_011377 [Digitaria exilis]
MHRNKLRGPDGFTPKYAAPRDSSPLLPPIPLTGTHEHDNDWWCEAPSARREWQLAGAGATVLEGSSAWWERCRLEVEGGWANEGIRRWVGVVCPRARAIRKRNAPQGSSSVEFKKVPRRERKEFGGSRAAAPKKLGGRLLVFSLFLPAPIPNFFANFSPASAARPPENQNPTADPVPPLPQNHFRPKLKSSLLRRAYQIPHGRSIPQSSFTSRLPAPPPPPIPNGHGTAASRELPAMAACSGADKENAAPSTSAAATAAVVSRRHGYGVRSCGVKKRPCRPRCTPRVPLRDITNLVVAAVGPEDPLGQEVPPAASELKATPDVVLVAAAAAQGGTAAGAAAKKAAAPKARYSLRKQFR